ncbi:YlxR family protein [Parathermosynechococcus lividus]
MGIPQRRCVACGRVGNRTEFWRIVRRWPDHTVKVGEGMGRSAYLCPTSECLKLAQQKKRLGRSLRCAVPDTVFSTLKACLQSSQADGNAVPPPET